MGVETDAVLDVKMNVEMDAETYVRKRLFEMQDLKYREFNSSLIPNVDPKTVIGVRTPQLRRLAKELFKRPEGEAFLKVLSHRYYEEWNLHGFLIEQVRDFGSCMELLEQFLPYIDNWATCDLVTPKVFKSHLTELLEHIIGWLASDATYTVRYGIRMLMWFYLETEFQPDYPELVGRVHSEEYYVRMAVAWYFATALTKQYEAAVPWLEEERLELWVHNKAIQKAMESYQVPPERKAYLKGLKRKI